MRSRASKITTLYKFAEVCWRIALAACSPDTPAPTIAMVLLVDMVLLFQIKEGDKVVEVEDLKFPAAQSPAWGRTDKLAKRGGLIIVRIK